MRSGPIIVLILVLWAAVLIPAILRRHDEATESKSVDRFTRAMRTLRRDDVLPADDHTVLMPRRPAAAVAMHMFSKSDGRGSASVRGAARPTPASAAANAPRRPAGPSLIARRRRAVLGLAVAMGVTFLVALVAGGFMWAVHGLIDGAAIGYVAHLRAEAKRAAQLARRRPRRAETPMANTPRVGTPLPGTPLPGTPFAAAPSAQLASYEARQAVAASAGDGAHRVTFDDEGAVGGAATASRAWQPIPVPVPTYVTAPKAPRRGRQIEVPPSWSDGLRDDDVEIDLAGLERIEPDLDRMLERRRAVND